MKWILIIILYGGEGKGAVDHVEFETQVACEHAKATVRSDNGFFSSFKVDLYCVPKGTQPDGKVEK